MYREVTHEEVARAQALNAAKRGFRAFCRENQRYLQDIYPEEAMDALLNSLPAGDTDPAELGRLVEQKITQLIPIVQQAKEHEKQEEQAKERARREEDARQKQRDEVEEQESERHWEEQERLRLEREREKELQQAHKNIGPLNPEDV